MYDLFQIFLIHLWIYEMYETPGLQPTT